MEIENITFFHISGKLSVGFLDGLEKLKIRKKNSGLHSDNCNGFDEVVLSFSELQEIVSASALIKVSREIDPEYVKKYGRDKVAQ